MKFFIYGVPNGFNLYKGTTEDDQYFQLFYDGSKEESKLTINRKENGEVVYNYLRYNMVSGGNRTGAFLGISMVLQNQYCENVVKLYDLFDFVFNDIILRDNILIEKANTGYRFRIKKFEEANTEEIEKIFQSLRLNIDDNSSSFNLKYIDSSFLHSKKGLICKLSYEAGNASFLSALKNFSWLTISKSYKMDKATLDVELSPEQINVYESAVKPMKDSIIQCYKNAVTNPAHTNKIVMQMSKKVQSALKVIKGYVGKQPQLTPIMEDYRTLNNQLIDLQSTILSTPGLPPQSPNAGPGNRPPRPPKKSNKKLFIVLILVLLGIYGGYKFFSGDSNQQSNLISQNTDSIHSNLEREKTVSQTSNESKNTEKKVDDQGTNDVRQYPESDNLEEDNQNNIESEDDNVSMRDLVNSLHDNNDEKTVRYQDNGKIQVDKQIVQKGETITVRWTGKPNGEWSCRSGYIKPISPSQAKITIKEIPTDGKANIVYRVNGEPKGSVVIKVVSKGASHTPTMAKREKPKNTANKPQPQSKNKNKDNNKNKNKNNNKNNNPSGPKKHEKF